MGSRPRTASIHILDDDSLLHVFYLYRPFLLGEDEGHLARLEGGTERWVRGRWWYKLAHVCERWRYLLFGSAPYLGISLVCTYGTPVADMLAHSPHLPLFIDYCKDLNITAEDEEQIILALRHRDRVSRVRLEANLKKHILAMDEEYPILEYLIVVPSPGDTNTTSIFSETFQAPHLRHLALEGMALPKGSRLLTSAVGLVTLSLIMVNPSTYFYPSTLLQWLSFMPLLETLMISLLYPDPAHDMERQPITLPITTPNILPNLHSFT